jgi:hypothetical protein
MTVLVDDLVEQVRVQVDEANESDLSNSKILQALQRAQTKLVRLATRRYAPMFRGEETLTPEDGTNELTIPESAFGLVVTEVDVIRSGQAYRVDPAPLSQLTALDNSSTTTELPLYYAQQGNKLRLLPRQAGSVEARVRYQRRPPDLVLQQGRIAAFDTQNVSVELDAIGTQLTTSIAALRCFVNWVDGTTGLVKATLQVAALDADTNTVTFKTSGLGRVTVFGQTVATELPADGTEDDYLCLASGTCIPMLVADYSDYLVQFAVVELKRKQGEDVTGEVAALKDLESDVLAMWAGRGAGKRVRRTNNWWGGRAPMSARLS